MLVPTLSLAGLVVVVTIGIASIQVREVTVLLRLRFLPAKISIALFLLALPLPARVLAGIGSLFAGVFEMNCITGVYAELYCLLLYDGFLPDTALLAP